MAFPLTARQFSERTRRMFWERVEITGGCWEWKGTLSSKGYGKYAWNNRNLKAHRMSFALEYGEVGELDIDHTCENNRCVRPDHLEEVTPQENLRRRAIRRKFCQSGEHPWTEDSWERDSAGKRYCKECRKSPGQRKRDRARQLAAVYRHLCVC